MEIFERELYGNLLFSLKAIDRNFNIILGSKRTIYENLGELPQGIFIVKSIVPGEINDQIKIIKNGHKIVCLDQEGLLQREGVEYLFRYSEESISKADLLLFWGKKQLKDFHNSFPEVNVNKLKVTGAPRADIWKLISAKNKKYFQKYKPDKIKPGYILFATSFGTANHFLGEYGQHNLFLSASNLIRVNDNSKRLKNTFLSHSSRLKDLESHMLVAYTKLLESLAIEFKNIDFVVRPHPSESSLYWEEIAEKFDNVFVYAQGSGSATDWMINSSCVIQSNSTLAVEAALMNVPVISYSPELPDKLDDLHLEYTKKVSHNFHDIETIKRNIDLIINNKFKKVIDLNLLEDLVSSRRNINSSENIINLIDKYKFRNLRKLPSNIKSLKLSNVFIKLKTKLIEITSLLPYWSKWAPKKLRHINYSANKRYRKAKQFKLDKEYLLDRVDLIKNLMNIDKKNTIELKELGKNVFLITSKS